MSLRRHSFFIYGQLTREDNAALDKTIEYEYNTSTGNLDSVTNNGTVTTFGYTDVAHPDRLTSYNGKAITYNDNGGVASYDGWDYTWTKGKLSRIKKNMGNSSRAIIGPGLAPSKTYTFGYNGLGQRISQNYSYFFLGDSIIPVQQGEITAYNKSFSYDHAGRLVAENIDKTFYGVGTESSKIVYLYDESGIIGMQYTNSTTATTNTYYFLRNLQGDVIAIYDTTGNKVVEYSYDAYGNCTINSSTTNYPLAHANPIRYRGYYYDEATKLYYLNARYYNPQWRRFISPDDTAYLNPETPNGLNLYCYCGNDPVNYADPSGRFAISATFGIGALIAITVTSMIIGGVVQLTSNALAGETGSDLWRGVAGAAFGTGANALALCLAMPTGGASLFIAAGVSTVVQTGVDTIETLIRKEKVGWNVLLYLGLNFATTLVGNYFGGKLVPINSGWTKPQLFKSIFIRPYGQKILGQTAIGAWLSGTVNFIREYDWSIFESILPVYTVPLYQKDYTGWK